jgi:hypothetical protein
LTPARTRRSAAATGPDGQVITTTRNADVRAAHTIFDTPGRIALPTARFVELIEKLTRG